MLWEKSVGQSVWNADSLFDGGGWWSEAYCGRTWMAGWKFGSSWSFKSDDTWIFGKTRRNCAHNSVTYRNFSQNKFQLCSLTISVAGWQKLASKFLILWKPQTSQPEKKASSYFWPPWKASHSFFLPVPVTWHYHFQKFRHFQKRGRHLSILLQTCSEARHESLWSAEMRDSKTQNKQKWTLLRYILLQVL